MNMQLTLKAAAIGCLVFFLFGVTLGAWGMHTWQVSDLRQQLAVMAEKLKREQEKPPVIQEKLVTKTETQLAYVPKETIKYIDPKTGKEIDQPLDGQFDIGKTEFVYTVNGKPEQFTKGDDERFIFDKNMLKFIQTSTVKLDVEVPTIDKTKHNAIGGYITTESWGAIASRETDSHRVLLMGGKKWDNENGRGYEAGGAWQVKF